MYKLIQTLNTCGWVSNGLSDIWCLAWVAAVRDSDKLCWFGETFRIERLNTPMNFVTESV